MEPKLEYGKVTVRIDRELYEFVQSKLHYGQQKKLFDSIFLSFKELIASNRFDEILNYMYHKHELCLPSISIGENDETNKSIAPNN